MFDCAHGRTGLALVTHEYAEPGYFALGLGRTGQFPTVVVSIFRSSGIYTDVAALGTFT